MVRLCLSGEIDATSGWMLDFGEVENHIAVIKQEIDHRYLNDIPGLDNPTTEVIATWLWQRCAEMLPGLVEICVQEHPTRGVIYRGPGT
jgi:6-pyruvoyltetrahydropterin/6-carboxytetrahydropterin synthase